MVEVLPFCLKRTVWRQGHQSVSFQGRRRIRQGIERRPIKGVVVVRRIVRVKARVGEQRARGRGRRLGVVRRLGLLEEPLGRVLDRGRDVAALGDPLGVLLVGESELLAVLFGDSNVFGALHEGGVAGAVRATAVAQRLGGLADDLLVGELVPGALEALLRIGSALALEEAAGRVERVDVRDDLLREGPLLGDGVPLAVVGVVSVLHELPETLVPRVLRDVDAPPGEDVVRVRRQDLRGEAVADGVGQGVHAAAPTVTRSNAMDDCKQPHQTTRGSPPRPWIQLLPPPQPLLSA